MFTLILASTEYDRLIKDFGNSTMKAETISRAKIKDNQVLVEGDNNFFADLTDELIDIISDNIITTDDDVSVNEKAYFLESICDRIAQI